MSTLQTIGIIVGVASGLSGLLLGILNYLHQRDKSRPRLVVRPTLHRMDEVKDGKQVTTWRGIIEVRNVGHMPVVGSNVGFLPGWRWRAITAITTFAPRRIRESKAVWSLQRREFHSVTLYQEEPVRKGLEWQQEVGPQHSVMVWFNPALLRANPPLIPEEPRIGRAYATTMVGDRFKASRRDMRRFVRQVEEFRLNQPLPAAPCTPPQAPDTPGDQGGLPWEARASGGQGWRPGGLEARGSALILSFDALRDALRGRRSEEAVQGAGMVGPFQAQGAAESDASDATRGRPPSGVRFAAVRRLTSRRWIDRE